MTLAARNNPHFRRRGQGGAGWTPASPTTVGGLLPWAWWTAASLSIADGAPVSSWADSSGNGRTVAQATEANQPSYALSGINGLPAVVFDGNDVLKSAAQSQAQPLTILAVCRLTTFAGKNQEVYGNGSATPTLYKKVTSAPYSWAYYAGTEQWSNLTVATNTTYLLCGVFAGASSRLRVNAAQVSADNPGTSGYANKTAQIGANTNAAQGWIGPIAEVVVYAAALGVDDVSELESYLNALYGAY